MICPRFGALTCSNGGNGNATQKHKQGAFPACVLFIQIILFFISSIAIVIEIISVERVTILLDSL